MILNNYLLFILICHKIKVFYFKKSFRMDISYSNINHYLKMIFQKSSLNFKSILSLFYQIIISFLNII